MKNHKLFKTKRDKMSFLIGMIPLVILYAISCINLIANSVCLHDAFMDSLSFCIVFLGIGLIYKQICKRWINTIIAVIIGTFTVLTVYISEDLIFSVIIEACIGIYLLYWIYFGKSIKFYLDKEKTPLKWFYFVIYFTIPVSILTNGLTLTSNIIAYKNGYSVHMLDILFPTIYVILAVVAIIGLYKFKPYALYVVYVYWLFPIIYYGSVVMIYMNREVEISQNIIASMTGSIIMCILNGIYFWKRRYLFVPYNPEIDVMIEYPDEKAIRFKRLCMQKNSNKSSLEDLRMLKELLDNGAITSEEYIEKKESILKKIN